MEEALFLFFAVCFLVLLLKLSVWTRWWQVLAAALVMSTACYAFYPLAEEQNVLQLNQLVRDQATVLNLAVLLLVESVLGLMICRKLIERHYNLPVKKVWFGLMFYPGLIPMVVLLYLEAYLFLQTTGYAYETLAIFFAGLAFAAMLIGFVLIRQILPEFILRLEVLLLLQFVQAVVAVVFTVVYSPASLPDKDHSFSLTPLLLILALLVAGTAIGYGLYLWKSKKQHFNHHGITQ
jgi:hypothetical protein